MTKIKQTSEPLEDEQPIPEDATEEEREQIREDNRQIRERNQERIANASEIGQQFGAARYLDGTNGKGSDPPGQ